MKSSFISPSISLEDYFRYSIMEDFDMDADDNLEQENAKSPKKKSHPVSGIALDALTGLLGSYSAAGTKVRSKHLILTTNSLGVS